MTEPVEANYDSLIGSIAVRDMLVRTESDNNQEGLPQQAQKMGLQDAIMNAPKPQAPVCKQCNGQNFHPQTPRSDPSERPIDANNITPIVFNAKRVEQVPRRRLAGCESAMHAAIRDHGTMLPRKLQSRILVVLQRGHQQIRLVADLIGGVRTEPRKRILRPAGDFDVGEFGEGAVGLGAEEFEERVEEAVEGFLVGHGFDALGERLRDLHAEFFGAGHDPEVDGDGGVVEDVVVVAGGAVGAGGCTVEFFVQCRWRRVEDELVVVLGPKNLFEFEKDFAEGAIAEAGDAVSHVVGQGRVERYKLMAKDAQR